jgi:hypothetical protein
MSRDVRGIQAKKSFDIIGFSHWIKSFDLELVQVWHHAKRYEQANIHQTQLRLHRRKTNERKHKLTDARANTHTHTHAHAHTDTDTDTDTDTHTHTHT